MTPALALVPLELDEANDAIRRWHRHHKPIRRCKVLVGARRGPALIGVATCEWPKAPALGNGTTWELTRLALDPDRPPDRGAGSMLARACWAAARAVGVRRLVTYTRADEPGTIYRAAGYVATARVRGRKWDGINKPGRWLPGLYEPTTEIVDRVRWEIGPDASPTRVRAEPLS